MAYRGDSPTLDATPGIASEPAPGPGHPSLIKRTLSGLAAAGAFIAKFGALIVKLKYASVVISVLVSIAAYALLWGWSFAAGFVALLFAHEMGHVLEVRRQKVPATAPTFIPFLGALIRIKRAPASVYQEAQIALGGPVAGTAASLGVWWWAAHTHSLFLQALAYIGFFLNLFNLMPALPLDGGRIAGALHPALWLAGLVGLAGWEIHSPSPILPIIIILGGIELWRRWRHRNSPAARLYYALDTRRRAMVAGMYLAVTAVALYGAHATYLARTIH